MQNTFWGNTNSLQSFLGQKKFRKKDWIFRLISRFFGHFLIFFEVIPPVPPTPHGTFQGIKQRYMWCSSDTKQIWKTRCPIWCKKRHLKSVEEPKNRFFNDFQSITICSQWKLGGLWMSLGVVYTAYFTYIADLHAWMINQERGYPSKSVTKCQEIQQNSEKF